jgi:cell division GTPase FtsZ
MVICNDDLSLLWTPQIAVIGIGDYGREFIDYIIVSDPPQVTTFITKEIPSDRYDCGEETGNVNMSICVAMADVPDCTTGIFAARSMMTLSDVLSICILTVFSLEQIGIAYSSDLLRDFDILIAIQEDYDSISEVQSSFAKFKKIEMCLRSIVELVCEPGLIGIDFADVRSVLAKSGMGAVGIGESARPENANIAAARAREDLARQGVDLHSVSGFLVNFQSGNDTDILEMDTALNAFFDLPTEISKDDKNIMVGWLPKPPMNGRCRVVVVAVGVSLGDR